MSLGRASARPSTIRDVSKLAGVSRMTVSRVLSRSDLVREDTRERVLKAIARLDYVPDRAAGSLLNRRTGFVGLIVPTLTNANFSTVAHGLTEVLRSRDYHLLITYNDYSLGEETAQLRNLIARRPEAIVMIGCVHNKEALSLLARSDVPVIEVAETSVRPIQHAVGFSNHKVGRMAARHLAGRGFHRIGAIGSLPGPDLADHRGEARLAGFEDELRALGLSTDMVVRIGPPPVSYDQGAAAMVELLSRHDDVEAVFCVSDLAGVGALMECERRGIAVPDQLSIMGFGDFDIGRIVNPRLSTIRVDFLELGREVGDLVLGLLAKPDSAPATIEVDVEIVERESIAGG